jgi:hypothetical protein
MNKPEKSIDEIVEEICDWKCDSRDCQHEILEDHFIVTKKDIRTILQAERQKRDEMVEAERERIEKEVLTPMYEEMRLWYIEKNDIVGQGALIQVFNNALQALTRPNNLK